MSTKLPNISVLIPTFNRAMYLKECLDSILSQTLPATQIIVINDGSTDNTRQVLEEYKNNIEYLEEDNLCSRSNAINHGLNHVTGDYLWIFDDDDVAFPDALERFVEPLIKYPEHDFSFSTFYYTDHQARRILGQLQIPDIASKGFLIPLLKANFLCGASLFTRSSVYDRVGTFLPQLVRAQDYEMAIRIARHFTGIQISGGPTFLYRQHDELRGNKYDRFITSEKRKYWLKYDQVTFRKIYNEIPLHEYLPPWEDINTETKLALLQRMSIMASKLLFQEVILDLRNLAKLNDRKFLSNKEKAVIKQMITKVPYYSEGSIDKCQDFFNEINRLSGSSHYIRSLQKEIYNIMAIKKQSSGIIAKFFRLFG